MKKIKKDSKAKDKSKSKGKEKSKEKAVKKAYGLVFNQSSMDFATLSKLKL